MTAVSAPRGATSAPSSGLEGVMAVLRKLYLFTFLRGWAVWFSYRAQVLLTVLGWVIPVFFYFVLAGYLTNPSSGSQFAGSPSSYVAYFVVGLAFQGFVTSLYGTLAQRIRSEQMMGTLEHLLLSPTTPGAVLLYSMVFSLMLNLLAMGLILGIGVGLLGVHLVINWPALWVSGVFLVVSNLGMAILASSFILWTKQGNPVAVFLTLYTELFGGVFFPVTYLPRSVSWISYLVPLNFGLAAVRASLLDGVGLGGVLGDLGWMALYTVVTIPLGLGFFRWTLKKVREDGTLATY
jgi:ABC-2 type transport system permease protein